MFPYPERMFPYPSASAGQIFAVAAATGRIVGKEVADEPRQERGLIEQQQVARVLNDSERGPRNGAGEVPCIRERHERNPSRVDA